jgi:hypothetical protein
LLAPAAGTEQVHAAQGDAGHDRRAASQLHRPERVTEQRSASSRADERLQVHERARNVGGHLALRGGEQGRRQDCPNHDECYHGDEHGRASRLAGDGLTDERDRQDRQAGGPKLQRGHRDRVAPPKQPGLRHGEASRDQLGRQHQPVTAQR